MYPDPARPVNFMSCLSLILARGEWGAEAVAAGGRVGDGFSGRRGPATGGALPDPPAADTGHDRLRQTEAPVLHQTEI